MFSHLLVPPASGFCLPDLAEAPGFPLWLFTGFFLGEVNAEPKSIFLKPGLSHPLLPAEPGPRKGTSWSRHPVFAVELMFSLEPIPAPGVLALPCQACGEGVETRAEAD